MTTKKEMALLPNAVPGPCTAAITAIARWAKEEPAEIQDSIGSLAIMVHSVFANVYRDNRPDESVLWHNARVANDVYLKNEGNPYRLLKTYIAGAHDLCEDSRKLTPEKPVTPEQVAALWRGTEAERQLITDVLYLKTDAAGLEGDARRAKQHQRANEAAAGKYGVAGYIFAEIMAADKKDNMRADLEDLDAKRIKFKSQHDGLEYVFKKIADAQIFKQLPVPDQTKVEFLALYEAVMRRVILDRVVPAGDIIDDGSNNRFAKKLDRAIKTNSGLRKSQKNGYYHTYAASRAQVLQSDLKRLSLGDVKFKTRTSGLAYAYARTAEVLTARASPIMPNQKKQITHLYDRIMRELLYAGSITPTVIGPTDKDGKPVRRRGSGREGRRTRLSTLAHTRN